jgi:hypothetical protein
MIVVPAWIVWSLQMNTGKKLVVFFAFFFRIVIIAAAIGRLYHLGQFLSSPNRDPTFDILPYAYSTQLQMAVAVIVACVPALKPFMDRADSGMMAISLNQRVPGTTFGHSGSYALQSLSKKSGSGSNKATNLSNTSGSNDRSGDHKLSRNRSQGWRPDQVDNKVTVSGHGRRPSEGRLRKKSDMDDVDSIGSDKMIIRQTRDWNVRYDDGGAVENGNGVGEKKESVGTMESRRMSPEEGVEVGYAV